MPSDAALGVLIGVAATLILAGAFYARVSKVTLPGGSGIELGGATQDAAAVAAAVNEEVQRSLHSNEPTAAPRPMLAKSRRRWPPQRWQHSSRRSS